jgi:phage replication-related protein YjqB (UPF0714/DUF867 family)
MPLLGATIDNHDLHLTYTKMDEKLKNKDFLNSLAPSSIHGIDPCMGGFSLLSLANF